MTRRTSAGVTRDLFDRHLRAVRRDRAAHLGPELFLYDRAFDDCLERLRDIARPFERALLIGCPSPKWPEPLRQMVGDIDVVDPGLRFAGTANGRQVEEDRFDFGEERYDLCIAIGTLDSVNDLPLALQLIRRAMRSDAPFIGAMAGGNSLATLRAGLIEAGRAAGRIVGRAHPRIDASSLAQLLATAGFNMPVVDIDRVTLRYNSLGDLIRDLRAMGATSVLAERPPIFTKSEAIHLQNAFTGAGEDGRTEEIVEILHFLAWSQ
ncbi:class I SAM-dependent methyltransferase [Sphingomonas sp. NSE70-1]|uniref:Class I SAM-dependent methyltransferase n=1 Tax=Sphingomonas caseinilyticus TaxID=2908205 RepID=A0ABT0RXF7_9SPHN|nr:methyltransferase domain-containing protein [Sphingomonas caseinilyticus]MCL6699641.1 class I SAM-dependent methyltransferase [Sphingomonas caseinilyticus]